MPLINRCEASCSRNALHPTKRRACAGRLLKGLYMLPSLPNSQLPLAYMANMFGIDGLIVLILVGIVALVLGIILTFVILKTFASSATKKSKTDAQDIVTRANSQAAELIKKAEVDGKAEYLRIKETAEREVDGARKEMRENEQRLQKREDILDRKLDTLSLIHI